MSNFEAMPPVSPDNNGAPQKKEIVLPVAVEVSTEESLEKDRVFQKEQDDDLKLSKGMTQDQVDSLAGRLVAQEAEKQETIDRISYEKMVNDQREMIRAEVLRNEEMISDKESPSKDNGKFSQDEMTSDRPGMSEWILSKLEHIPGGKRLFAALTLVVGLSAISMQAAAQVNNEKGSRDRFEERGRSRAEQGVTSETGKLISRVIRAPLNTYDNWRKGQVKEQQKMDRQMMQEQQKAERAFRSQDRAAEQYIAKVAKEVNAFNKSFDKVLLQKFKTDGDRDIALLKEASETMNSLERSDSQYIGKYGGNAHGLSAIAKEKLQNFSADIKSGKYSGIQWVENPLAGVTLERYIAGDINR